MKQSICLKSAQYISWNIWVCELLCRPYEIGDNSSKMSHRPRWPLASRIFYSNTSNGFSSNKTCCMNLQHALLGLFHEAYGYGMRQNKWFIGFHCHMVHTAHTFCTRVVKILQLFRPFIAVLTEHHSLEIKFLLSQLRGYYKMSIFAMECVSGCPYAGLFFMQ